MDKWIAHISFEIAQYPSYSSGGPGIANDPHFLRINISIQEDMKSPSTYSTEQIVITNYILPQDEEEVFLANLLNIDDEGRCVLIGQFHVSYV